MSSPLQCWTSAKSKDQTERSRQTLTFHSGTSGTAEDPELLITEVASWNVGGCFLMDASSPSTTQQLLHSPTTVERTSLPSAAQSCVPLHEHPNTGGWQVLHLIRVCQSTMPLCNSSEELYAPISHWTQAALYRSVVPFCQTLRKQDKECKELRLTGIFYLWLGQQNHLGLLRFSLFKTTKEASTNPIHVSLNIVTQKPIKNTINSDIK